MGDLEVKDPQQLQMSGSLASTIANMFSSSYRANSEVYGVIATYLNEDLVQLKHSEGLAQT